MSEQSGTYTYNFQLLTSGILVTKKEIRTAMAKTETFLNIFQKFKTFLGLTTIKSFEILITARRLGPA